MKALVFTAVFNGIAAIPLLFLVAKVNDDATILADNRGGKASRGFVWLTFAVMILSELALIYTTLMSKA